MGNIKKCDACNTYTLHDECPVCGGEASSPEPPKFSYPDKYGEYRRKTKQQAQDASGTDVDGEDQ